MEEAIRELDEEIRRYEQTIRDTEGALDAAEKELNELLSAMPAESPEQMSE